MAPNHTLGRDVVPGWDLIQPLPDIAIYELRNVAGRYNLKWRGGCIPRSKATNIDYWNRLADTWATISFRSDEKLKAAAILVGADGSGPWWRTVYDKIGEVM